MHYPSSFFLSEAFFSRESCAEVDLFLDPKQTVPECIEITTENVPIKVHVHLEGFVSVSEKMTYCGVQTPVFANEVYPGPKIVNVQIEHAQSLVHLREVMVLVRGVPVNTQCAEETVAQSSEILVNLFWPGTQAYETPFELRFQLYLEAQPAIPSLDVAENQIH